MGRVLRVEPRAEGPVGLLDTGEPRSDAFILMCSWCKRVQDPEGSWLELEEAVRTLRLFSLPAMPWITHGICDSCEASVDA